MKRILTLSAIMMLMAMTVWAQTRITGVVTSAEDGSPVAGAVVSVTGNTSIHALTDAEGRFTLNSVPSGAKTVEVSVMGMISRTVPIEPKMQIALSPDKEQLEDVMVLAYGTARKSSFAGSAVQVRAEEISDIPATSFENALIGRISGVTITSPSGQAGSTSTVRIRGNGSMNASNEPLYVIDGVPVINGNVGQMSSYVTGSTNNVMATLNTNDIESISVLKDAAASSLYGSRAANGVIIITTKQGQRGRPVVNFKASYGITPSWATGNYETATPQQQADMLFEVFYDYRESKGPEAAVEYALKQLNNKFNQFGYRFDADPQGGRYQSVKISEYENSGRGEGVYFDWDDALFRTAVYQNYDVSVSGGNDKSTYYSSFSYTDEQGRVKINGFKRFSGRVNLNQKVGDRLEFATSASISRTVKSGFNDTRSTGSNYFMQSRNLLFPFYWPTTADGEEWTGRYASYAYNALYHDEQWENATTNLRINGSETLTLHIIPGLDAKTILSYDNNIVKDHVYFSASHFNGASRNGVVHEIRTIYEKFVSSSTLNYNRAFGRHSLGLLAGFEAEKSVTDFSRASGENLPTSTLHTVATAGTTESNAYNWGNSLVSVLCKADYNYDSKYYLSASYRRDGSSKLSPEKRWGDFWSVSGAWRIVNEAFMKSLPAVSDLKLRASYGVNGTLPSDNYGYMNLISYSNKYLGEPGGTISSLGNYDLSWETSYASNIGLDLGFFNQRLTASVEYFNRDSKNLLQNVPVSTTTGFSSLLQNVGVINNHGVELEIAGDIVSNKHLTFSAGLNAAFISSSVKSLYGGEDIIWNDPTGGDSRAKFIYREGESTRAFYGYEWAGVDPANGKSVYYANNPALDASNLPDGYFLFNDRIASYDYGKAKYVVIGNAIPKVSGGFFANLASHGFDLALNFIYKIGGDIYDGAEKDVADDGYYWNRIRSAYYYNNRWTESNPNGTQPALSGSDLEDAMQASSRHLYDASFLRLKSATLGYSIPKSLLKKVNISSLRLYFTGGNLLTFKAYPIADPEVGDYGTRGWETPLGKSYTFGLDIRF
ncbi:MAG: SusC/RagA family TonB-linked outer membrane protein [Candidatus Cryptobacteroides sp.]